ncbi:Tyrosine-protein kinase [Parasponia andersonii]|uniref:Tyrosine-protein kinase n=1 Tax=Parasponia andersonii TaxID=3476 RepID=A0A2P5D2R1_PARAD|nr:Tyrosine-protein kinase [Parasponia andersonii]
MSSHRNALKLLGCCLELSRPALVYEDVENGPLCDMYGFISLSPSWNMRLKVAKETASAITYLHTAFARPIIHRGIAPSNILIDKDSIPKLCNFDQAITIPEGETHVQVNIITGANFYLEHAYALSGIVTEHTDIYSFGVVLLFLISGKRPSSSSIHDDEQSFPNYVRNLFERERFMELVDPKILEEEGGINEEKEVQLQAFLKLAWICLKENGEDRPLMIDVAKELVKIERSAR